MNYEKMTKCLMTIIAYAGWDEAATYVNIALGYYQQSGETTKYDQLQACWRNCINNLLH